MQPHPNRPKTRATNIYQAKANENIIMGTDYNRKMVSCIFRFWGVQKEMPSLVWLRNREIYLYDSKQLAQTAFTLNKLKGQIDDRPFGINSVRL